MALVFLVGGTGNQLFQYSRSSRTDQFSTVFLKGLLPRVLGWSRHEIFFRFDEAADWKVAAALCVLPFELALARILKRTIASSIDLKFAKGRPLLSPRIKIGYFQDQSPLRDVGELRGQLASTHDAAPNVAMHVRGGDVLRLEEMGNNPYGVLTADYYRSALARLGGSAHTVSIFTDDPEHAEQVIGQLEDSGHTFRIETADLKEMMSRCLSAEYFVSSNSTLSYWIVEMRGAARRSVCPVPFTRSLPVAVPEVADTVAFDFATGNES